MVTFRIQYNCIILHQNLFSQFEVNESERLGILRG